MFCRGQKETEYLTIKVLSKYKNQVQVVGHILQSATFGLMLLQTKTLKIPVMNQSA